MTESHDAPNQTAKPPFEATACFELLLNYQPPYDWPQLLDFLRMRAIPGVESVSHTHYSRTVCIDGQQGWLRVKQQPEQQQLQARISANLAPFAEAIRQRLRLLFDTDGQPAELHAHLADDALLGPLIKAYPGSRVPGAWDGFEVIVRAVLGQQVSVAAAKTLATRVVERHGQALADSWPNSSPAELWRVFPTPKQLATGDLSGLGITGRRIDCIQQLAQTVSAGQLDLHQGELDDYVKQLVAQPGIGDWTAQYIAMRALHHPNAFPAGDLVLRKMATDAEQALSTKALRNLAEAWRPLRAYAVILLWRKALDAASQPKK